MEEKREVQEESCEWETESGGEREGKIPNEGSGKGGGEGGTPNEKGGRRVKKRGGREEEGKGN